MADKLEKIALSTSQSNRWTREDYIDAAKLLGYASIVSIGGYLGYYCTKHLLGNQEVITGTMLGIVAGLGLCSTIMGVSDDIMNDSTSEEM